MKLQFSQDTNVELSSENEQNSGTEEEKQDSSSCSEHLEAPTTSKKQRNEPAAQLVTSAKLDTRKTWYAKMIWEGWSFPS